MIHIELSDLQKNVLAFGSTVSASVKRIWAPIPIPKPNYSFGNRYRNLVLVSDQSINITFPLQNGQQLGLMCNLLNCCYNLIQQKQFFLCTFLLSFCFIRAKRAYYCIRTVRNNLHSFSVGTTRLILSTDSLQKSFVSLFGH